MAGRRSAGIPLNRLTSGLQVGSLVKVADNSGARLVRIIGVKGYRGRLNRIPHAGVGAMVIVSVRKGTPQLRRQIVPAIIVRQKKMYRRRTGEWISFEENAVCITNPAGDPRGTEIRGPVAKETAEHWPRVAQASSIIV